MEQDKAFGSGQSLRSRCPFCHGGLSGETYTCGQCGTTHHKSCWDENNGCTAIGCGWNSRVEEAGREKEKPPFVPHDFTQRMSPATAAMWSTLASLGFLVVGKYWGMDGEHVIGVMAIIVVVGTVLLTWYSETKRRPGEATLWQDFATWWRRKR
jgi:hypothetical protein